MNKYGEVLRDVVKNTINVLFALETRVVEQRVIAEREPPFAITGIITFSGRGRGRIAISFPRELAGRLTAIMLGERDAKNCCDQDIQDCVGELANIVGGNLLPALEGVQEGEDWDFSLPEIVVGLHQEIWSDDEVPRERTVFQCGIGAFAIVTSFQENFVEA